MSHRNPNLANLTGNLTAIREARMYTLCNRINTTGVLPVNLTARALAAGYNGTAGAVNRTADQQRVYDALVVGVANCTRRAFAGYREVCNATVDQRVCYVRECGANWTGRVTRMPRCNAGIWEPPAGCMLKNGTAPMPNTTSTALLPINGTSATGTTGGVRLEISGIACSVPFAQAGFAILGCGQATRSGTVCAAKCAAGNVGRPEGWVACVDGAYVGSFVGCQPPCALPPHVCAGGNHTTNFTVTSVFPGHKIMNDSTSCSFTGGGSDYGLVHLECGPNRVLESGSLRDAVCIAGTLYGGWVSSPPRCVPLAQAPIKQCKCGEPGETSTGVKLKSGAFIELPEETGSRWVCWESNHKAFCYCKCE